MSLYLRRVILSTPTHFWISTYLTPGPRKSAAVTLPCNSRSSFIFMIRLLGLEWSTMPQSIAHGFYRNRSLFHGWPSGSSVLRPSLFLDGKGALRRSQANFQFLPTAFSRLDHQPSRWCHNHAASRLSHVPVPRPAKRPVSISLLPLRQSLRYGLPSLRLHPG